MPRTVALAAAVSFACVLSAAPLAADDRTVCVSHNSPADAAIIACTRIIHSGLFAGRALAFAYNSRGIAWRKKGNPARAMADYDEAIRLDPGHVPAYSNRGNIHLNTGRYESAIADYDRAIRLDANNAFVFSNRGQALGQIREYARAIADYDQAIRLRPQFALAHNGRAWVLFKAGQFAEALESAERAAELAPASAPILDTRAHIREALGDLEGARADFKAALAINSELIESHEGLARVTGKLSTAPQRP
jgi:tetratricopeptide (TPR) repeat protein